jgi:hypothetical protein
MRNLMLALLLIALPAFAAVPTPTPVKPTAIKFTQAGISRSLAIPAGAKSFTYNELLTAGQRRFAVGGQWVQFPLTGGAVSSDWIFPTAVCPPVPPDASQLVQCSVSNPGTTGTWTQTHGWAQTPPLQGCVVTPLPWVPSVAPAGACTSQPPPPGGLNLDLSFINTASPEYANFIGRANRDDADAEVLVWAYLKTGMASYCTRAVALADDLMTNNADAIADDSYLYVDGYLVGPSLAYAKCPSVTSAQRARWKAVMDMTMVNLWGGIGWSGWALDQWANNYHYSFMGASIYWALASGEASLLADVRNTRIPFVMNGLATIPAGGGSLEGTGYGYAFKRMERGMLAWRDSGQGDLANANAYTGNNVRYWTHALVPTMDRFAPIGDQPRVSEPYWYDYNREEMLSGQYQSSDPIAKAEAGYALSHTPNQDMQSRDNYIDNMYPYTPTSAPPVLVYRAPEVGSVFARTAWTPQATWFSFLAGRFEQSHAAREQGSFTLFGKGDWIAVTNNIHSHSGIQQGSRDRNMPRFVHSGQVKEQDYAAAIVTAYTAAANGDVHIVADLSPLYQVDDNMGVQRWQRTADFVGGVLTIADSFTLGSGTSAIEQVQFPTQPSVAGNVITTANARVTVISPANAQITIVPMTSVDPDYTSGYRVEFPANGGAQFKIEVSP